MSQIVGTNLVFILNAVNAKNVTVKTYFGTKLGAILLRNTSKSPILYTFHMIFLKLDVSVNPSLSPQ